MHFLDIAGQRVTLPDVLVGDAGERFRLRGVVLGGGNAMVFRARPETELARDIDACAVKVLRRLDGARLDRFSNEIRIMRELDHDRISQVFDTGTVEVEELRLPWAALELGGDNLRRTVDEHGPLSPDQLVRVGVEMSLAVQHVHDRGIIHRDLKPDNFVWDEENPGSVLMIDFGIAKRLGEDVSGRPLDTFTKHLEFVGPVFFSSPELIAYSRDKNHPVDHRSDLFQLGKTLWFLGTSRISAGVPSPKLCPFGGRFCALVTSLLQDEPEDRPQSATEVIEELRAL